jgi:hypothetical protein
MQNSATISPKWLLDTGDDLNGFLGTFDESEQGGLIKIYTAESSKLGTKRTSVKGCSYTGGIIELQIDFKVERNTPPYFKGKPITKFVLQRSEHYNYNLPDIEDSEGNDEP